MNIKQSKVFKIFNIVLNEYHDEVRVFDSVKSARCSITQYLKNYNRRFTQEASEHYEILEFELKPTGKKFPGRKQ